MTWFPDLTPYEYGGPHRAEPGTVNVGWLAEGKPFSVGDSSGAFRLSLLKLVQNPPKKYWSKGSHRCEFCKGMPERPIGPEESRLRIELKCRWEELRSLRMEHNSYDPKLAESFQRAGDLPEAMAYRKEKLQTPCNSPRDEQLRMEMEDLGRKIEAIAPPQLDGSSGAEIRVNGDGVIYAAPCMIYHYVVIHRYLPPEGFIRAVLENRE